MITLGIETSCDETSVAVIKDGKQVLSNSVYTSLQRHRPYGGVVPEIAHRAHLESLPACLDDALKKASVSSQRLDLIAVTQGPGLMGSLLVGMAAAKAAAFSLGKPLVGVDHVIAHVYAGFLSEPQLRFPVLGLVVSGGHTMIIRMDSPGRVRVLGRSIDDAAGEAFDKVAKILGLGYPGGPEVDHLSRGQDSARFSFTRPFLSKDSLDFSFSGIKTAVYYAVEKLKKEKKLRLQVKKEICAGFQEAVCEVLVEKSLRAARQQKVKTLIVGGGVSANHRLRQMFKSASARAGVRALLADPAYCQDNGAMIGALGSALYKEGRRDTMGLTSYSEFGG